MNQRLFAGPGVGLALTLLVSISVTGCGVILGGTTETISVTSVPSAARLTTEPLTGSYTTPSSLELERKKTYTLVLWKEGYQETQVPIQRKLRIGPLIGDIVLGLVGVIVDAATGGWWDLSPDQVTASLEPLEDRPDLQPILVTLSTEGSGDGTLTVEAAESVHLRLLGH